MAGKIAKVSVPPASRRDCGPAQIQRQHNKTRGGRKTLYSVTLPIGYISDWIGIFEDLELDDVHRFIKTVMVAGKRWINETLRSARRKNTEIPHSITAPREDKKQKLGKHHLVASSRDCKRRKNIVTIPQSFHRTWHRLFGNLTPEETHVFIDIVFSGKMWTRKMLKEEQIRLMRQTEDAKKAAIAPAHAPAPNP